MRQSKNITKIILTTTPKDNLRVWIREPQNIVVKSRQPKNPRLFVKVGK